MHNHPAPTSRFFFAALLAGFVASGAPALGQVINEDTKLLPTDGFADDQFGISIAIDNGVIAVGAIGDDDNGSFSGSAYLFDATTGAQLVKLLPNDGAAGALFGFSIAIDNGIVAVGARLDDGNEIRSGSAYLFNTITGTQIVKLIASDGALGDSFGWSIAIDQGIVAVGAYLDDDNGGESGSAYLFDASTGAQIAKLLPSDGANSDEFGWSIAIDHGIVAVGASRNNDNGSNAGSAYLFDASTGVQLAKLLPDDGAAGDRFGLSIAINNGIVAVGAPNDSDNGPFSGSAYLFDAITGTQITKIIPSDGAERDFFGNSIALHNNIVAIGAFADDDNGLTSGSAYLFNSSTGAQIAKILPSDGAANDLFGDPIAIANGIVAVGALGHADNGFRSGAAYVFDVNCPADLTGSIDPNDPTFGISNFILDANDFFFYLGLFGNGDLAADLTGSIDPNDPGFGIPDGTLDNDDFFFYLGLFAAGCL